MRQGADGLERIQLNGIWRARQDPRGSGVRGKWYTPDNSGAETRGWESADVPSCWNCDPRYKRYEGVFWYATDFELPANATNNGLTHFLRFLAVNYHCRVWLNGREVGTHEGGYLPFEFVIDNDVLETTNRLVVRVENFRARDRIPGENFDWMNYGGIVRDVELIARTPARFQFARVSSRLSSDGGAFVRVNYSQTIPFNFKWSVLFVGETVAEGAHSSKHAEGAFEVHVQNARKWSPDAPNLYILELYDADELRANDGFRTTFGIREIRTEGSRILLNGEPIKFRGASLHEELVPYGRCVPKEERWADARAIKAAGFNALRTAHYTHDEELLRAADETGLLVFEEIPIYWDIDYDSEMVKRLAEGMVGDMIARDFNHPCVVAWSVGNEIPVENSSCDKLIRSLMDQARSIDPGRLVTYVSCRFVVDKTRSASDVCCINCYLGWYYGNEKDLPALLDMTRSTAPDKPWIMTEFGACAEKGFRSANKEKFSEDRQAEFISSYIRTLNSHDWISGWFIWIWRDFSSPIRINKHQKRFNRKGLVSESNNPKLILEMMPRLLEEKSEGLPLPPVKLPVAAFELLERAVCLAQPFFAAAQKRIYDRFFRR